MHVIIYMVCPCVFRTQHCKLFGKLWKQLDLVVPSMRQQIPNKHFKIPGMVSVINYIQREGKA